MKDEIGIEIEIGVGGDVGTYTMTLPSGSKLAVEWYILAIVVVAKPVVNRWPAGAEGVYNHGVRTG